MSIKISIDHVERAAIEAMYALTDLMVEQDLKTADKPEGPEWDDLLRRLNFATSELCGIVNALTAAYVIANENRAPTQESPGGDGDGDPPGPETHCRPADVAAGAPSFFLH